MARSVETVVLDYLVFIGVIGVTLTLSFYTRLAGPKENTKANYVFSAASKISSGAMMFSFARATLGVRSFLGYPSELYYHGVAMYETLYGYLLAYPIVSYLFVPVYFHLGVTSVYQYLDLRFKSQSVRLVASGTYLLRNVLTLGVTLFTPCVALKTVVGFPYWASIVGIAAISVLCAVVGGMKAAILGDVVQGLIMIGCTLVIIIRGMVDVGSVDRVVRSNYDRGRLDFFNFDTDPTLRVTTVSAVFGQLFMSLSVFGCQQNFVQRICSMRSMGEVRRTLWINIPVIAVLFSLSWVVGMVIFASYVNCDPLTLGYTTKIDEIVPFYVEDKFVNIPGMMGMFMASLFNGALSLSVSNLNSMSTVAWEDFLSKVPCFREFSDKQQLAAIKSMGVVFGLLTTGIAFGVALMSGVVDSSQMMMSATSGPLLGVFVLALYFPGCNWKGALAGMFSSHAITLWITYGGRTVEKEPNPYLPLSVDGCGNHSFSGHVFEMYGQIPSAAFTSNQSDAYSEVPHHNRDVLSQIYSVSYMYYSLIGCLVCVISGLFVSLITGSSEDEVYDEALIHPWVLKVTRLLPGKPRRYLKGTVIGKKSREVSTPPDVREGKVPEEVVTPRYSAFDHEFSYVSSKGDDCGGAKAAISTETITSRLSGR